MFLPYFWAIIISWFTILKPFQGILGWSILERVVFAGDGLPDHVPADDREADVDMHFQTASVHTTDDSGMRIPQLSPAQQQDLETIHESKCRRKSMTYWIVLWRSRSQLVQVIWGRSVGKKLVWSWAIITQGLKAPYLLLKPRMWAGSGQFWPPPRVQLAAIK